MNKKEKISIIIERLKNIYPDTRCTLDYDEAYKLLISVRLAAQCTDARVNQTVPDLFAAYPTIDALAGATVDAVESIIRPCGLGKSKARDIVACMQMLRDIYNYHVPDTMEELLKLPGVGRKSANLILGDIYGKPAIVTDTHCIRLSNRLGLSKSTLPAKVEQDLRRIVPPSEGNALCHRFVDHGRAVCTARNPHCDDCTLRDICSTPTKTQCP
jgi:endonuclease-3